jgi:Endoplasmic reticulum vesicle transporter
MVLPEGLGSTGLYQYFIKVVPTLFTDESKNKLLTNQYTFTERFRPLMLPDPKSGLLTAVSENLKIVLPVYFRSRSALSLSI